MITKEYEVIGRYITQEESEAECLNRVNDDMNEVFVDYEIREVK